MDRSDVFMSYRRTDVEFVKRLDSAFRQADKEVWVDWEDIPPGAVQFSEEIRRGIEGADAFVAVLTPDFLQSTYCVDLELGYAVKLNKRIIPVVLRKLDGYDIPQSISHINWIYFTPHAGQENPFDAAFANVMEALVADFDYLRDHTRLMTRAQRWEEHKRDKNFLLNSAEVQQAEAWLAKGVRLNPSPAELHSDYILASREAATRSQRRVRTIGLVVIALMGVLLIVAAFLAYEASTQREAAELSYALSQTAEAEALTQRNDAWNTRALFLADLAQDQIVAGSPQESLVLALESLHHYSDGIYNYESQLALLDALANPIQEVLFIAQEETLQDTGNLFWSADESRVLSWGGTTAAIYSLTDLEAEPITFQHEARIEGGFWSPDETQLMTWVNILGECDNDCIHAVNIWDVANPTEAVVTIPHEGRVDGAEWNAGKGQVLTWSNAGGLCNPNCKFVAMLWDVNAPDTPLLTLPHPGPVRGATFAQAGSRIITWTEEGGADNDEYSTISSIYMWDPANPARPIWSFTDTYAEYGVIDGVQATEDHRYLLAFSLNGFALVWDLEALDEEPIVLDHDAGIVGAGWAPDAVTVITWLDEYTAMAGDGLYEYGGTIQFWDIDEPDEPSLTLEHDSIVYGASLIPDQDLIISWGEDGYVQLWPLNDPNNSGISSLALAHRGPVYDAILSSDGGRMLTRSVEGIHLWDLDNQTVPFHYLPAELGLPNPDGTHILMVPPPPSNESLPALVIDLNGSPSDTQIIGDGQIYAYSASWSPDGTQVALAED